MSTQPPATVTAGHGFGFEVTAEYANGSVDAGFSGSITASLTSNPGGSILGGVLTMTAQHGVATFSGLTLNRVGKGYKLRAQSGSLTPAITNAIEVTPGPAVQLVATTEPPAVVAAGAGFSFKVSAEDVYGNVATDYVIPVSATLATNPGGSKLGGTLTVTPADGVASFSEITLNKVGTGYTILTHSGALIPGLTSLITVTPGTASKLVVTTEPPDSVVVGAGFGFAVLVEDASGNVVPSYSGSVTASIANNPAGGALGGTVDVSVKSGVALFSGLTLNKAGTGYTLEAKSGSLTAATTNPLTVGKDATKTVAGPSTFAPVRGQAIAINAIVSVTAPGAGVPTGTVTFKYGSTVVATEPLVTVDGVTYAALPTPPLALGTYTFTTVYTGDANDGPSSATTTFTVGRDATRTIAGPSIFTPVRGQGLTLYAVVAVRSPGVGTPTGTVTFKDGSTVVKTEPLVTVNGQTYASLPLATLAVGSYSFTAVYNGDADDETSSATTTFAVDKDATTTVAGPATYAPVRGQALTVFAVVAPKVPGAGVPTGTVTFKYGSTALATAPLVSLDGKTFAQWTSAPLGLGTYTITTVYNGDSSDVGSTAATTFTVGPDATTTVAGPSILAPVFGQALSLNAIIAVKAPGAGTPTGTVTFKYGSKVIGTATLKTVNGLTYATLPLPTLGPGTYTFTAVYSGDAGDLTSSTTTTFTVSPGASKAAVPALALATPPIQTALAVPAGPSTSFLPIPVPGASGRLPGQGRTRRFPFASFDLLDATGGM